MSARCCDTCGASLGDGNVWMRFGESGLYCSSLCSSRAETQPTAFERQIEAQSRTLSAEQFLGAAVRQNALAGSCTGILAQAQAAQQANTMTRDNAAMNAQTAAMQQARGYDGIRFTDDRGRTVDFVTHEANVNASPDLVAARKRIEVLEARETALLKAAEIFREGAESATREAERANRLGDEAGALRSELTQVKAELCDALRDVERLKRKAGAR